MELDVTESSEREQLPANRSEFEEEDEIYLSLYHGSGKLGGAFYDTNEGILYVINDLADPPPKYKIVLAILAQLNPKHLLLCSRHKDAFAKASNMRKNTNPSSNTTETTEEFDETEAKTSTHVEDSTIGAELTGLTEATFNETVGGVENVKVLPSKEFGLDSGKRRILSQKLPGESDKQSSEDHHLLIHSLINHQSECMIRACGALLKYLDRSQVAGPNLEGGGGAPVLAIRQFTPQDIVRVDENTISALQIFCSRWQNSGAKSGSWNQKREGLSVFSLLNRCKSAVGSRHLKFLLRCLPRSLDMIQMRQDAIAYFSDPAQHEIKKVMHDIIKKIKSVAKFLKKMSLNQVSVQDWKSLKSILLHMLSLGQVCHSTCASNQQGMGIFFQLPITTQVIYLITVPEILKDIAKQSFKDDQLGSVVKTIEKVFDIEESEDMARFVVKKGVDAKLDEKKYTHNNLANLLHQLAIEEVELLPDCMTGCTMTYLPQLGYLLAIDPWPGIDIEDKTTLEFPDMRFMFFSRGQVHYKSKKCVELDQTLGDTATIISDHETSIMLALSTYILEKTDLILNISHSICQLDCLLALATVARDNDWCKPEVSHDEELIIRNGRHPLQEQCVQTFVANDSRMSKETGKVMVMTGPNACGKSVYLKQIGIITFLAHLGSWVPASYAKIPLVDAIYTRIQTIDSISLGLSAFAVDLNQMSLALNNACNKSLVLVDEFGKGTADVDGQALLAVSLDHWLEQDISCPFVVVSTHFHSLPTFLRHWEEKIQYVTFMIKRADDDVEDVIYLYKVIPGTVTYSEANNVAKKAGIDEKILSRSSDILATMAEGKNLSADINISEENFAKLVGVIDNFQAAELTEENLSEIFRDIHEIIGRN